MQYIYIYTGCGGGARSGLKRQSIVYLYIHVIVHSSSRWMSGGRGWRTCVFVAMLTHTHTYANKSTSILSVVRWRTTTAAKWERHADDAVYYTSIILCGSAVMPRDWRQRHRRRRQVATRKPRANDRRRRRSTTGRGEEGCLHTHTHRVRRARRRLPSMLDIECSINKTRRRRRVHARVTTKY